MNCLLNGSKVLKKLKMTIKNLISNGNLEEALKIIAEQCGTNGLMLLGRYNRQMKSHRMGTVSSSSHQIEINKIVQSALYYAEDLKEVSVQSVRLNDSKIADLNETALLDIIKANKRRKPDIAEEAKNILTEYRQWSDSRTENPSFDIANRRQKSIVKKANDLIEKINLKEEDNLIETVNKINQFLSHPVPTYKSLESAYKLSAGRGFNSEWIEKMIQLKPNDDETRIRIAELIEEFAATL